VILPQLVSYSIDIDDPLGSEVLADDALIRGGALVRACSLRRQNEIGC